MKRTINKRLTLSAFKDKQNLMDNLLATYTKQIIAYGLEQHLGTSSGTPGGSVNIRVRGQGSLNA